MIVPSSLVSPHKTSHQYCKWASSEEGWSGAESITAHPKYEKYRARLGAVRDLDGEPISTEETGPPFKGELRLNIDWLLGIYT